MTATLPLRVLVVDDNPGDAALIRLQLEELPGYAMTIEVTSSLTKALELLASSMFEVTFLDLGLPECHGSDTYARFRVKFPAGTVIVLSGDSNEEVALATVRQGAQDFLVKGSYDRPTLSRVLRHSIEREKIEADLRMRESRWAALVAAVPVEITELDTVGRVLFSNGHLGPLAIQAPFGSLWVDGFPPADRAAAHSFLNFEPFEALREPLVSRHEFPDRAVFLQHRLSEVRTESTVTSWLIATSDVTSSVEADSQVLTDLLAEQTANTLAFMDNPTDAFSLVLKVVLKVTESTAGAVCQYNQVNGRFTVQAVSGRSPMIDELPSVVGTDFLPDRSSFWGKVATQGTQIRESSGENSLQVLLHHRGALVLVVLVTGKHRPYSPANMTHVLTLGTDLHLLLQNTEGEWKKKKLLRAIDRFPFGVALSDAVGGLGYVNAKFRELMGSPQESDTEDSYLRLLPGGRDGPLFRDIQLGLLRDGQWQGELRAQDSEQVLELAIYRVSVDADHSPTYAAFIDDITQKRTNEEFLTKARKMGCVGQMAAGLAHDLNNVLGIITSYSQLLRLKAPAEAEGNDFTHKIELAAQKASGMVSRLLSYGRRNDVGMRPVDLNRFIADETEILASLVRSPIVFQVKLSEGQLPVNLDCELFGQVLMNLVINARDALIPGPGSIVVSTDVTTRDGAEWALVEVADSGPGIPVSTRKRIFEPFFSTKNNNAGTGLGLAMVWGAIEQHGAKIEVDCPASGGTRFIISLKIERP